MNSQRLDLDFSQGETFQFQINITDANSNPLNLSLCSAVMDIKISYSSNTLTESLSTANSEIVLGTNAGIYNLTLPATRTANIPVDLTHGIPPKTTYVYNFIFTDASSVSRKLLFGNLDVYGQV